MTMVELARLVAEMRAAQRDYFRSRSSAALESSKRLERATDKAVAEIMEPQPSLFGGQSEKGAK